jgi:chromosomal replication initiation ATPase DnaA
MMQADTCTCPLKRQCLEIEVRGSSRNNPPAVDLVEQLVMRAFEIVLPTLVAVRRGRAQVAFARQVAIYLTHVHLGLTLTASARFYCRDRTTASHACRRVEDRREDPEIDRRIEAVETALDRWFAGQRQARYGIGQEVLQ